MIDGSYVFLMQISDIEVIYRKITIYNLSVLIYAPDYVGSFGVRV